MYRSELSIISAAWHAKSEKENGHDKYFLNISITNSIQIGMIISSLVFRFMIVGILGCKYSSFSNMLAKLFILPSLRTFPNIFFSKKKKIILLGIVN